MKTFFRRAAASILCAALLCPTALASEALGSRVYGYTLDICDRTTLTKEVMWSASRSDLRTENYVTYTPSASVSPKVSYGNSVVSTQTVSSVASSLEKNGKRVLSGINGDYYVMATGDPLGILITDGILRSSDASLSAVGFNADGTAIVGSPYLDLHAKFNGKTYIMGGINKVRGSDGYYLFTDDFSGNTKNTLKGVDVVLVPSGELKIGQKNTCKVEEVIEARGSTAIPQGKFILSASSSADASLREALLALNPGDTVEIDVTSYDTRWNEVDCAVGGLYRLITKGELNKDLDTSSAAPRTAIGTKADGSVIFYTIDGRQAGYSVGATIKMVGQRLLELGCTDAILLDGGGSTTMVSTYPDYVTYSVVNKPSEGQQRSVSNAVFLVSNLSATGTPGSLYVSPASIALLSGATTQCKATAVDTGWYPMSNLPGEVTWSSPQETVSAAGVFTAPAQSGSYTVSASLGEISGSAKIQVYDTPDSIYVTNKATGKNVSTLTVAPGEKVDFDAAASYRGVGLTATDSCFTWTADPAIGTIDENGVFTAGKNPASGKIKVAAGSHAITMSIDVNAPATHHLITDFESAPFFTSNQAKLSLSGKPATVAYGSKSLAVPYTSIPADLSGSHTLTDTDRYLSLWVYGDQSGNTLSAVFDTGTQGLGKLDFSGWKRLTTAVPSGAVTFTGLRLEGEHASGTLYLDQLTLSNEDKADTTAPQVSLTVKGSTISAKITDNSRDALAQGRITLAVDGEKKDFTWSSGTLSAILPELATGLHQVTVTAADACGNIGRASYTTDPATVQNPFADMSGHWAAAYTSRLNELGIITGIKEGGKTLFYPGRSITRGDFALMAARWLDLDLKDYANVTLPYDDAASIPDWDRDAVKALYALEIMQGSADKNGKLYANAKKSITRAEAMTILSRMQPKGFGKASLSAFSDAASVPAWAKDSVASLVEQKVVGGSNGQLRPSAAVSRAEVAKMLLTLW